MAEGIGVRALATGRRGTALAAPETPLTRPPAGEHPLPEGEGQKSKISFVSLRPLGEGLGVRDVGARHGMPLQHGGIKPPLHQPWRLPARGLAVFHGAGNVARLSHYFLPRLLMEGKRVLFLDGANSADPRLLERFARERRVPFADFNRGIQIARAFTCFQLTELIARAPKFLADFPAEVVIVTAFPDLYFDEDVRDWNARVAFEQGLRNLRLGSAGILPAGGRDGRAPSVALAVFSAIGDFAPPPARRQFFPKLCAAANEVWRFSLDADNRLRLTCTQQALRKLNQ